MLEFGEIIKIADDTFASDRIINSAKELLIDYLQKNNKISAAQYRDLLNTNRKSAITLLEYFDNIKITKRVENDRILNKLT
jgi:selenocysteine-specific elongation factor